jgi:hypothetical protein
MIIGLVAVSSPHHTAIALLKNDEPEKAEQAFLKASEKLNQFSQAETAPLSGRRDSAPWFDTIESFLLYQEAARLLS